MSSDLGRSLRDLERDVDDLNLAPAAQVRARGEARRRHRMAAATAGLVLLAGAGVAVAATGPRWPFTAGDGGASATSCPPQPVLTNRPGEARIYMKLDATRAERDAVETRLRELNLDPTVVDRAEAWRLFQAVYCDEPDLVARTRPGQMPEYLIVTLDNQALFDSVQQSVQSMPAVDAMVDLSPGEGSTNWSGCSTPPVSSDGRRVTVFLRPEVTDEQREAIAAELRSLPGIASFDFANRQQAYERFTEIYSCVPELVEATRPESLPESFQVTLTDPSAGETVKAVVGRMPGVDAVVHIL
jgi:hypothetical protein